MTSQLRVLVEQPTRGKRWVAVAADWPGLERGGKTEDEAVEKLARYVPRYLPVAKRVRLGSELATQTDLDIIGRYPGIGSTDFWGISFAPSPLDREPFDAPTFDRQVRLLRAAWAEFDETAARVSAELRPGVRGGGRSRDRIIRHVLANEGGDFSKRVKAKSELEDLLTPGGLAHHRDRFVEAMRAWYAEGKPLGKWTIPYLLRHTAYHVLDHTWEMQDRDLTDDGLRRMTAATGRRSPGDTDFGLQSTFETRDYRAMYCGGVTRSRLAASRHSSRSGRCRARYCRVSLLPAVASLRSRGSIWQGHA